MVYFSNISSRFLFTYFPNFSGQQKLICPNNSNLNFHKIWSQYFSISIFFLSLPLFYCFRWQIPRFMSDALMIFYIFTLPLFSSAHFLRTTSLLLFPLPPSHLHPLSYENSMRIPNRDWLFFPARYSQFLQSY